MLENKIIRKITAVAFWVTVWFIVSAVVNNSLIVASPVETLCALWTMLISGDLLTGVLGSLVRIMLGFVVGNLLAVVMSVASFHNGLAQAIISPFMNMCKAVPVAAFAVMLIIWWGPDNLSMLISIIVVLPIVYNNVLEGLKSTDKKLLEMSEVLEIPVRNKILFIFRPSLNPFIEAAFKMGIGMCWKAGVAAEVIGLCSGSIGGGLYTSKVYFDTASVFAWAGVTVLISYAMEKLVLYIVEKGLRSNLNCATKNRRVTGDGEINISGLYKKYESKILYEDLCADWNKGEVYKLNGASGSGKTTLLRMIAGLEKPDSGTIRCGGKISMMFQENRLCEDFSAICNVAMTGIGEEKAAVALEKVLDKESLNKPCRELSGGMKRRVALVRAMECPSDVVLLDEPFTGLDEDTLNVVKEYIDCSRESKTIIVASHIL